MLEGVRLASGDGLAMAARSATCGLWGGVDEREWTPSREERLPPVWPWDIRRASTDNPPPEVKREGVPLLGPSLTMSDRLCPSES
jgi:hypothetical protein